MLFQTKLVCAGCGAELRYSVDKDIWTDYPPMCNSGTATGERGTLVRVVPCRCLESRAIERIQKLLGAIRVDAVGASDKEAQGCQER